MHGVLACVHERTEDLTRTPMQLACRCEVCVEAS